MVSAYCTTSMTVEVIGQPLTSVDAGESHAIDRGSIWSTPPDCGGGGACGAGVWNSASGPHGPSFVPSYARACQ